MGIYERKIKSKIFIFVLGELIFSSVSVYTITYFSSNQVTYNNKASGLKARKFKLQSMNYIIHVKIIRLVVVVLEIIYIFIIKVVVVMVLEYIKCR